MIVEKSILYVEDDEITRECMNVMLIRIFKKVFVATNGYEAFEIFKHNRVDLVLTDLDMPIINGIELIKLIKIMGIETKIFVYSARKFEDIKELKELKITDFFQKPLDYKVFKESMKKKFFDINPNFAIET